ncbi:MAG: sulfatase [Acidimicrobiales bacterium]|nr:sulfatase [Acidimicrobiales bacterium]
MASNVVLVVFDTARRDAFAPYGAQRNTPAIAEMASRGAAHPNAYATASWTVPSHASLFSGKLPRSAGFQHRGATGDGVYREANAQLDARGELLPGVLRAQGYETRGLSGNTWITDHTGFHRGFDEFRLVTRRRPGRMHKKGLRDRLAWRMDAVRARLDDGAAEVGELLESWIARRDRKPFFWFVNLIECHSPYMPPLPFNPLSPVDRWRAADEASEYLNVASIWKCSLGGFDVPDDAIERMRLLHNASAAQLDAWVARLLTSLDKHGLLDDTQIVLTSDHGENLGDGKLLGHSFSLDDRLLKVPLVTAGPSALPTDSVFSLAALPAWLCSVAGVEEHPFEPEFAPGVAVAQLDAPGDGSPHKCLHDVQIWDWPDDGAAAAARLGTSITCATDGRLKLSRPHGTGARAAGLPFELLVDLEADPVEMNPRAVTPSQEVEHAAALRVLRAALDRAAELERPKTVPRSGQPDRDEALAEQLAHLGYL